MRKRRHVPVRIFWKADSTALPSIAEVSIKLSSFSVANAFASSVGTARRCLKSDLLPTNMMLQAQAGSGQKWSYGEDSHLHNVAISVIPQLLQPPRNIDIGLVLCDVIYQERSNCSSVVGGCDGTVALLAGLVYQISA